MNIWLVSDNHWSHFNVIKYCSRPFISVGEMNQWMIDCWNECVQPEDTVYHLGDFSLNNNEAFRYVKQLNGKITIVPGNHDGCSFHRQNKVKQQRLANIYEREGFFKVSEAPVIQLEEFSLCHFPRGNKDPRFEAIVKQIPSYGVQLHGHCHSSPDKIWNRENKTFDVGIDGHNFYPWHIDEIRAYIKDHS